MISVTGLGAGHGTGDVSTTRIRHTEGLGPGHGTGAATAWRYAYRVRWYDDNNRCVAEGEADTPSEAVTCAPVDGSGVTVECTLAYTGNVLLGDGFLDLKWPASFKRCASPPDSVGTGWPSFT